MPDDNAERQAAGPAPSGKAAGADRLEVPHSPHPFHRWREFLKEYGTIVLSVLTALALGQTVEAIHHRHDADETRRALNAELAFNLASFRFLLESHECVDRRLDELSRWSESTQRAGPLRLTRPLDGPPSLIFRSAVWRVASTAGLAQMPFADRVDFGQFYDSFENNDGIRRREIDLWSDLGRFGPARTLTVEQFLEVQSDIAQLRRLSLRLKTNSAAVSEYARTLGITPKAPLLEAKLREQLRGFCVPILAQ